MCATTSLFTAQRRLRIRDRKMLQAPPRRRISGLPQADRRPCSKRVRRPYRHGQSRNPHNTAAIKSWLARRPHYHVHFTLTSTSWINQVERWSEELTRKQSQRGVRTSTSLRPTFAPSASGTMRTPSPTSGPNSPKKSSPPSDVSVTKIRPYATTFSSR